MNFDGVRVLVVGDVMLDHYIAGQVKRISPEAPVPVVSVAKRWSVPGGAANVARNLVRLGVDVAVAGVVGQDAAAADLRAALAAEGIADGLTASASRRTTCKTRVLAQGQQLMRLDEEVCAPLSAEDKQSFLRLCCANFPLDAPCVHLSGGERQRVFLAICLSFLPKVLMLDEPTSALDQDTAERFMTQVLGYCRQRGMTVVAVSHDPALTERHAENVISLRAEVE